MSVVTRGMKKRGFLIGIDPEDTRWQELPPEMLEMILEYVSKKTDLLTCRLINSTWEASATSVIQKQSLRTLTAWRWNTLNATPSPEGFLNLFPRVIIPLSEDKGQEQLEKELLAVRPKSGIDLVSTEANPIITKSLCLIGENCNTSNPVGLFRASTIFETHGSTLTSLQLNNVDVIPEEAIKILSYLDNLVALNLEIWTSRTLTNINPKFDSFLPKLTHLSCATNSWMITWLLKHVASQLVSLKCASYILMSAEKEGPLVFDKLKELRVYYPNKEFLVNGFRAPILERLHLESLTFSISYEELMGFISQFASTLIELELNDGFYITSLVQDLKRGSGKGASGGVSFKKMMTFTYTLRRYQFDNPVTWQYLKTLFLSRFPTLKSLNLTFRTYVSMKLLGMEEASTLCQRNDIWNFCSKLKAVQIKHIRYFRIESSVCFGFTREQMQQH